jgi:hypothetical protein
MLYLGTHHPHWLARVDVPLFVSRRTLARYKTLPRARGRWALDSGGFTELSLYGEWRVSEAEYVAAARRFAAEVGGLDWIAPMDWMCEPLIRARTGLSVAAHQERTVDNFLRLRALAPDLPIAPVVQGWTPFEYVRHAEQYGASRASASARCAGGRAWRWPGRSSRCSRRTACGCTVSA